MSEENKAVVRRFFEEGFNQGNGAVFDELVAEGTVDHDPQNPFPDVRGPEGSRRGMEYYRAAFPDLRFTIEDQIAEGNMVATRFTGTGTHEGEMAGIAPTHKQTSSAGVSIDRIENGKIAETWVYWDALGLMQQLGAVPAPAAAHA